MSLQDDERFARMRRERKEHRGEERRRARRDASKRKHQALERSPPETPRRGA